MNYRSYFFIAQRFWSKKMKLAWGDLSLIIKLCRNNPLLTTHHLYFIKLLPEEDNIECCHPYLDFTLGRVIIPRDFSTIRLFIGQSNPSSGVFLT